MADTTGHEDDEDQPAPKRNWRKELEDQAKAAEERAARFERELAFTKAGLDGLSDKQVAALGAVHQGEMTPDALKATAKELGFVTEPAPQMAQTQAQSPAQDQAPELAELARLANSPADHETPSSDGRPMVDLEDPRFESNDFVKEFLGQNLEWIQPDAQ